MRGLTEGNLIKIIKKKNTEKKTIHQCLSLALIGIAFILYRITK